MTSERNDTNIDGSAGAPREPLDQVATEDERVKGNQAEDPRRGKDGEPRRTSESSCSSNHSRASNAENYSRNDSPLD